MDEDGAVWTWGRNDLYQLGYKTTGTYSVNPRRVELPLPAVYVTSYNSQSFAILEDGSLWSWGNNGSGQLGQGLSEGRALPGLAVEGDVVLVASGSLFAVCVLRDGTVLCAGENNHYELGTSNAVNCKVMTPNGLNLID